MHPLSGSNLGTLVRVLFENGGVSPRHVPQAALAGAATLARLPFTTAERVYVARRLRRAGPMPPPIFIVGHWRSGTTHLYNILSKADFGFVSPLAAGMPWDLFGIVGLIRPWLERALPKDRYIDAIPVEPDSPQEDEVALANMTPLSFYHGLYFPRRFQENFNRGIFFDGCDAAEVERWKRTFTYLMHKLWLHQGGRRLLIKNPVYTARVAMLRELFPDAKFIHVYRNPYEVFRSMQNFHHKLLHQFALQRYDEAPIDHVVLDVFSRMMDRLVEETAGLPEDVFVEVRYERLERDPVGEVERVYRSLRLEGFEEARPKFEAYLASVSGYSKNRYVYPEHILRTVEQNWGPFLRRWGYRRPAADRRAA